MPELNNPNFATTNTTNGLPPGFGTFATANPVTWNLDVDAAQIIADMQRRDFERMTMYQPRPQAAPKKPKKKREFEMIIEKLDRRWVVRTVLVNDGGVTDEYTCGSKQELEYAVNRMIERCTSDLRGSTMDLRFRQRRNPSGHLTRHERLDLHRPVTDDIHEEQFSVEIDPTVDNVQDEMPMPEMVYMPGRLVVDEFGDIENPF